MLEAQTIGEPRFNLMKRGEMLFLDVDLIYLYMIELRSSPKRTWHQSYEHSVSGHVFSIQQLCKTAEQTSDREQNGNQMLA